MVVPHGNVEVEGGQKSEGTKERRSEGAKERRSEGAKEGRNEV